MCVCVGGWVLVSCASVCDVRKYVRASMRVCVRVCIIGFQCSVNVSGYYY